MNNLKNNEFERETTVEKIKWLQVQKAKEDNVLAKIRIDLEIAKEERKLLKIGLKTR